MIHHGLSLIALCAIPLGVFSQEYYWHNVTCNDQTGSPARAWMYNADWNSVGYYQTFVNDSENSACHQISFCPGCVNSDYGYRIDFYQGGDEDYGWFELEFDNDNGWGLGIEVFQFQDSDCGGDDGTISWYGSSVWCDEYKNDAAVYTSTGDIELRWFNDYGYDADFFIGVNLNEYNTEFDWDSYRDGGSGGGGGGGGGNDGGGKISVVGILFIIYFSVTFAIAAVIAMMQTCCYDVHRQLGDTILCCEKYEVSQSQLFQTSGKGVLALKFDEIFRTTADYEAVRRMQWSLYESSRQISYTVHAVIIGTVLTILYAIVVGIFEFLHVWLISPFQKLMNLLYEPLIRFAIKIGKLLLKGDIGNTDVTSVGADMGAPGTKMFSGMSTMSAGGLASKLM